MAQRPWQAELVAVADPDLLRSRATLLGLPLDLLPLDLAAAPSPHRPGTLRILPVALAAPCHPGELDPRNAPYVVATLQQAVDGCLRRDFSARHYLIGGDWGAENIEHAHRYRMELVLEAKKDFASRYGLQSEYWQHFDPAGSPGAGLGPS